MNVERISLLLRDCLGPLDENNEPTPGTEIVDVWRLIALKPERVRQHEVEMIELLENWPSEIYGRPVPELGDKITYLEAGAVLEDQRTAFLLFAFGKMLGWWIVRDPHTQHGFKKTDAAALQLVGMGMISIDGYKPAESTRV